MKKLNNKGFSLVELIIVIAIMAILVGVVGTQVIPYLEKSRQAKDMQIFSSWNTAAMSAYSMNADKVPNGATVIITVPKTGTISATNDTSGQILATFKSLIGEDVTNLESVKFASKAGAAVSSVTCHIDGTSEKVWTVVAGGNDVFGTIENK